MPPSEMAVHPGRGILNAADARAHRVARATPSTYAPTPRTKQNKNKNKKSCESVETNNKFPLRDL